MTKAEYYVYVYIDPRNLEEFYYGKGRGKRKEAHLSDKKDSEKTRRIKAIQKEGLEPIIKVVAKNLQNQDALLIEKTLIWKLGKNLTNVSPGHFADNFRPHNTLHLNLAGFDYNYGIFYVNVGDGETRCWEDCKKYGFLSAGQGRVYSDSLRTLNPGDIVVAYQKRKGYVGIGAVIDKARRVNNFLVGGKTLHRYPLKQRNIFKNSDNNKTEYLVKVKWIKAVNEDEAKWKRRSGLLTSPQIKVSLDKKIRTLSFLEKEFGISFKNLLLK